MDRDPKLEELSVQMKMSEQLRSQYEDRWVRAINLLKGKFRIENTQSKVRKRDKMFFRKIWATIIRLCASMYQAFMKDPDTFRIEGRDTISDPHRASVLQKLVEYRRDRLNNKQNMFIKFIWAFQDIFTYGVAFGKLTWVYREDKNGRVIKDEPEYVAYPPEQCFPDLTVETKDKMRYCHFLNYPTFGEMEERKYKNLDKVEATTVDSNSVRDARHQPEGDPKLNYQNTNYAGFSGSGTVGGTYPDTAQSPTEWGINTVFKVYESFWIEDGVIKYGVHNDFNVWLEEPRDSPYGTEIPLIMGLCLTEPHQLIGEGFPDPLEAPQESFNYNLNMRKDNIASSMAGQLFVSRHNNVDMQSLLNRRKDGIVMMDDPNMGVKHEQVPDVTRTAYMEGDADSAMMDEMSGVTPGLRGMEETDKATVAQINYSESNAKIDFYTAIVGETFVKGFVSELTRQVILFETDETAIRIANENFRKAEEVQADEVYDFGTEADVIITAGIASGREAEIKQTMLALDRGIMIMQATQGLMQMGAMPKGGYKLPNVTELYMDLLKKIGKKDFNKYLLTLGQPQMPQEGKQNSADAGARQPQVGNQSMPAEANMIQEGSSGGI